MNEKKTKAIAEEWYDCNTSQYFDDPIGAFEQGLIRGADTERELIAKWLYEECGTVTNSIIGRIRNGEHREARDE